MKSIFKKRLFFALVLLCVGLAFVFASSTNVALASQNELDISGLKFAKAVEKAQQRIDSLRQNLQIKVLFENQQYVLSGGDLIEKDAKQTVEEARNKVIGKGFFDKINIIKNRSKKVVIKNIDLFLGVDDFVDSVAQKAQRQMQEPNVKFNPNKKQMFFADDGVVGVKVNKQELKQRIANNFNFESSADIALPVILTRPTKTAQEVVNQIEKRANFSTNYSYSVGGRRHNVLLSLSAFNGLVVKPNQIVSFNDTLSKIPTSSFKPAKIIINGEFVDGIGGGMCQASSTLYNAVLLAGLETLKSYSHSLPVGYVKFGFDAMVNPGSADLVFKNNTDSNVYIKAFGNNDDCFVEIYGEPMPKGLVLKRKSVNVGTIKHQGDKIIPDTKGIYADKALFKGEFHRVKYPQEGYEAKSYLQFWVDGQLVEEKYLRHSRYNAQQGIVYEGVETLPEGMEEVKSTMYPIKEKQGSADELSIEEIEEKMKKANPAHFNP